MEVVVHKTHQDLDRSSSREPGVRSLLYEARTLQSMRSQRADEQKLCERLKAENPKMALAQIMEPFSESTQLLETKFGKSPQGSYASYQLSTTEDNFKVYCNISSVPRVDPGHTHNIPINAYPRFPLNTATEEFVMPDEIAAVEKALLEKLCVDEEKINDFETKTRGQSNCEEWKQERKFRFTASNFGLISARKRNHESFVNSLLHPKPFSSRYTSDIYAYQLSSDCVTFKQTHFLVNLFFCITSKTICLYHLCKFFVVNFIHSALSSNCAGSFFSIAVNRFISSSLSHFSPDLVQHL
ncbi:uncharacterized protein [Pocillopora verrucosa]|uniref:uncharacterized protein isoform X1 n=1 Tax=Pocillopora verrucosa TaxID=203993 RepID=UPI0033427E17